MMPISSARQQGMAIIAALLVVAAAAAMAALSIERQGLLASYVHTERNRAQAGLLLRAGLDWARLLLQEDARLNSTTRLDGLWAQPVVSVPLGARGNPEHAFFSGRIEDAQARYNLHNLAHEARINTDEVQCLETLLRWLGRDPKLAAVIAQRVADSQSGRASPARRVGLRNLEDLLSLDELQPQDVEILQPFVTFLPAYTSVNVNTAPAEVLGAVVPGLGLARARLLVAQRDRGQWFVSRGDFINRIQLDGPVVAGRLGVSSQWFQVSGELAMDDMVLGLQALLHRAGFGSPLVRWIHQG